MEIVVKHTITLDPEVIALLKGFSGQQAPVKDITSAAGKGSRTSSKSEVAKENSKEETPPAQTGAEQSSTSDPEVTFTDIRQLYLEKKDAGKQEKIKAILDEYGVKKLSEFKPYQFTEVYNKIKAA